MRRAFPVLDLRDSLGDIGLSQRESYDRVFGL